MRLGLLWNCFVQVSLWALLQRLSFVYLSLQAQALQCLPYLPDPADLPFLSYCIVPTLEIEKLR